MMKKRTKSAKSNAPSEAARTRADVRRFLAFSINELSEKTGIDRRTIKKRLAGVKPLKGGKYAAEDVLSLLRGAPKPESERNQLLSEKLRHQIERIKFENEVRRKEFIHIDTMNAETSRSVLTAKSRLLSLPGKVAQLFSMLSDPADIEDRLRDEIRKILASLCEQPWAKFSCAKCGTEIKPNPTDDPKPDPRAPSCVHCGKPTAAIV